MHQKRKKELPMRPKKKKQTSFSTQGDSAASLREGRIRFDKKKKGKGDT